ncbi:MAG: hypothetical protein R3E94_06625 [Burkholderiaceae bacterium]
MPWRRPKRPTPPDSPCPVPDSDAVRRAALAASWQRDRRIAQRRLTWRWALWYLHRYYLHALGVLAVLLALGWLVFHGSPTAGRNVLPEVRLPASWSPVKSSTAEAHADAPLDMPHGELTLIPTSTYADLPRQEHAALVLRLLDRLGPDPFAVPADPAAISLATATPTFITENWLHSKEP